MYKINTQPSVIIPIFLSPPSFQDITVQAIFFDAVKMAVGYLLMFGYTMFFLGRTNLVEHRSVIALLGILSVGFGLMIGMGVFVIIGIPMVFYIWRFVNDLLSGRFDLGDAALAAVLLVIFIGFLRILAKRVHRWHVQLDT